MTNFLISLTVFTLSCWLPLKFLRYRFIALSCMVIAMVSSIFLVYFMIVTLGELLT